MNDNNNFEDDERARDYRTCVYIRKKRKATTKKFYSLNVHLKKWQGKRRENKTRWRGRETNNKNKA